MYLKHLEISGFKTFAQKTEVELAPGLMVVVGPNGSGKSNLTDAVRYCLGEQSVKTLRANKQEELIFAGTPTRKASLQASVTAVFDNSDNHLNLDFSEVAVTRKTNNQGESQYYINKTPCRLKDIHELFMGSGIGPGSFSFLGMREIDQVLSSDPKERKQMIEETAGTNKYKFRKKEASRKLEQTSQNLLRLKDILSEVEKNLEESKKSLSQYDKYKNVHHQLKDLEEAIAYAEYQDVKTKLLDSRQKTAQNLTLSQKADAKEHSLALELEELEKEHSLSQANLEDLQNQLSQKREILSGLKATLEGSCKEEKRLETADTTLKSRVCLQDQRINERRTELALLNQQLPILSKDYEELNKQLAAQKDHYSQMPDSVRGPVQEIRTQLAHTERKLNQVKSDLAVNLAKYDQEKKRLSQIEEEKAEIYAQWPKAPAKDNLETIQERIKEAEKLQEELKANLKEAENALKTKVQQRFEKERNLRPLTTRTMELEALSEEGVGLPGPVRTVMSWNHPGTVGVIGELIKVKPGLDKAFEAALGGRMFDVAVESRQDASVLIDRLKRERKGRVTFWPLDLDRKTDNISGYANNSGVVGTALELIEYNPKLHAVLSQMLGQTLVLKDLHSALSLYDTVKGRRPHIVTLDGEYLSPTGAVTGGSFKEERSGGILVRKRALEESRRNLDSLKDQITALLKEEENQKAQIDSIKNDISSINEISRQDLTEINQIKAENARFKREEESFKWRLQKLEKEAQSLAELTVKRQNTEQSLNHEADVLGCQYDDLKVLLTSSQEEEMNIQISREKVRTLLNQLEADTQGAKQKYEEKKSQLATTLDRLKELELDFNNFSGEKAANQEERNKLKVIIAENAEKIRIISDELKILQDTFAEKRSLHSQRDNAIKTLKDQHNEALKNARINGETVSVLKAELDVLEQTFLELTVKLSGQTRPNTNIKDFDIEKSKIKASRLRHFLENFGSVNLGAREDYERLSKRYESLSNQIADLDEASLGLKRIMEELDTYSVAQFKEVFQKVKVTFSKIFQDMFGGGFARLELSDPNNLLESGVDIIACPPGKRLQNLSLFSSGERALSAIAFLLALLTHKPSPIVVLDELDATLDDSNVEKIADKLVEYSHSSQFLFITHNRKTMEYADRLFGVTMEEPGVSRLLSVELQNSGAALGEELSEDGTSSQSIYFEKGSFFAQDKDSFPRPQSRQKLANMGNN